MGKIEDIKWAQGVSKEFLSRNITEEVMREYGVRTISSSTEVTKWGATIRASTKDGEMIALNYDPLGNFNSFKRIGVMMSKKKKYFWHNSEGSVGYFPYNILEKEGDRIFICAGEKDALTMLSFGYLAMSMPNGESSSMSNDLAFKLKERFKEVYVLYDADNTGHQESYKLAGTHGFKRVMLTSPLKDGEEDIMWGKDVNELFDFRFNELDPIIVMEEAIMEAETVDKIEQREALDPLLDGQLNMHNKLRQLKKQDIVSPDPIIRYKNNGPGIIFPNTINVVKGPKGAFKSSVAEVFGSLLLSKKDHQFPELFLGMDKDDRDYHVVYIDTERDVNYQFPRSIQSMQQRAGFKKDIDLPNFSYFSLLFEERRDRFDALKRCIDHVNRDRRGFLVIIMDVVTDCVSDFNSLSETNAFMDKLNTMVNRVECSFICVIHENPGSEKSRGHLGTEIVNKASLVLQVKRDVDNKEIVVLKHVHNRWALEAEDQELAYDMNARAIVAREDLHSFHKEDFDKWLQEGLEREKKEIFQERVDWQSRMD